jgi:hypothetical protein
MICYSNARARVPRDGVPVVAKAMSRAQEKNNLQKGNYTNSFTILNDTPVEHLCTVISDLDLACDDSDAQISTFRAEELVRAELAQANYNIYLSKINEKTTPRGEEDLVDFAMNPISNVERGHEIVEQNIIPIVEKWVDPTIYVQ